MEQVRRGNDAAFEVLYDRHHRGILSFCRHMLSSADEAEDAVQQTFISAYSGLRTDARDIRLKPWLYTIARNRCLSTLRSRREQPGVIDDVPTTGLSDQVQQRSDLRDLLEDMRDLPVDQRAALVLSELGDLSHAEVGAVVGCEAAKVKSLVFQARSSLIDGRRAREIPCHEIREQLATLSGGALRRAPLRRHLKSCKGCAEFRDEVRSQRKSLAAVLPVVPTLGLKQSALAAIGLGGGGGAAAGGGGAAGGGIASMLSSATAVKVATVLTVAGVAIGGGLTIDERSPSHQAEAAGGQDAAAQAAGAEALPVVPRALGPGTHAIKRAPAKRRAHGRSKSRRDATKATPGPVEEIRLHGHSQGGRSVGRGPGGRSTPQTEPAPAQPHTPSSQGNRGRHLGWQRGVRNPHRDPDTPARVPGRSGEPSGGGGASDVRPRRNRTITLLAGALPPGH